MNHSKYPLIKSSFVLLLTAVITIAGRFVAPTTVLAATIRVPQDQPTIQAAINAAQNGDLVLVSPGTYTERLTLSGKTITLASQFHTTGDQQFIHDTILDGQGSTVITVNQTVGPDTKIVGFTIRNGEDGIATRARIHIRNNRIVENVDGIDSTSGGGFIQGNTFEANRDDGVDFDQASSGTIEDNIIRNNGNDGIEIRLHQYSGATLEIIIRNNSISGNLEDGIQLIDYPDLSNRVFRIERNLITTSAMVGLGLMDNGVTVEDFRAASIPERIYLFNNTFVDNPYALTGGNNLIALNNLFVNSTTLGLKNVDASSIAAYNLFWNNGTNYQGSNIDTSTTLVTNPLLDSDYQLQAGSPAIDAGTAHFEWNGETVLDLPPSSYTGTAPDLGRYERNFTTPSPTPTLTSTPIGTATPTPTATSTPPPPSNLVQNASFELDTNNDGKPDMWSTNAKFTRSAETAPHAGTFAGRFFATKNASVTINQIVPNLTAGRQYTFSGWVQIPAQRDSTFSLKLQLRWRDANGAAIRTDTIKTYSTVTSSWNQALKSLVAPPRTTSAQVLITVNSLNGTMYVDDFVFGL